MADSTCLFAILASWPRETRDPRTAMKCRCKRTNCLIFSSRVLCFRPLSRHPRAGEKHVLSPIAAVHAECPPKNLEQRFFSKCGANTLGGDDTWTLSELMLGSEGPWTRYHMSKLANSVFAMAMHKKCQEKGLQVKALAADPGNASSNLQVSSTKGDGLMSDWFARTLATRGHSAPDGSLDISMCAFSPDAKSGDMYAPENGFKGAPKKTIEEGKEVKKGSETATTLEANQTNVWKWCEEGLGIKFDV
mmetsp:Transcript_21075/g.48666  ORF Transcript_21075/g.48666 Transcript_21075/m.48666 type:complete len:248 (-) Transcript_21075:159-902(-)